MSTVTYNEFAILPEDMKVEMVLLKAAAVLVSVGVLVAMVMLP